MKKGTTLDLIVRIPRKTVAEISALGELGLLAISTEELIAECMRAQLSKQMNGSGTRAPAATDDDERTQAIDAEIIEALRWHREPREPREVWEAVERAMLPRLRSVYHAGAASRDAKK